MPFWYSGKQGERQKKPFKYYSFSFYIMKPLFSVDLTRSRDGGSFSYRSYTTNPEQLEKIKNFLLERYGGEFMDGIKINNDCIELTSWNPWEYGREKRGKIEHLFWEYKTESKFIFNSQRVKKWDEMKTAFDSFHNWQRIIKAREKEYIDFILSESEALEKLGVKIEINRGYIYPWEDATESPIKSVSIFGNIIEYYIQSDNLGIFYKLGIKNNSPVRSLGVYNKDDLLKYSEQMAKDANIFESLEYHLKGKRIYNTL